MLQPGLASLELASRVQKAGLAGELPLGEQLAGDLRAQLKLHEDRCRAMLQQGQVCLCQFLLGIPAWYCFCKGVRV